MDWGTGWEGIEDPITVTLLYTVAGAEMEQAVARVWKSAEEKKVVATSPAILEATFCRFQLWSAFLSGITPTKGMKIRTVDNTVWHIDSAETQARGSRFRLHARKDRSA